MGTRTTQFGWAMPALSAAVLIAGCESSPRPLPYTDNPLLQSRQPLLKPQVTPTADASQIAQSGPRPVNAPPPGLYQQPPTTLAASRNTNQTDSSLTQSPQASALPAGSPTGRPRLGVATPPFPMANPTTAPVPSVAPVVSAAPLAPAPVAPPPAPPSVAPQMPTAAPAFTPSPAVVTTSAQAPVPAAVARQVDGKYGHAADYTWLQGELDQHYRGHLELRYRPVSEDDPYGGKVRLADDPRLAEFRPGDIIAVEGELSPEADGTAAGPWAQYRRYQIRAIRLVERK